MDLSPDPDRSSRTPGTYRAFRTDAGDPAFQALVAELDRDLAIRDGKDHAFFAQFNKLDDIRHAIVIRDGAVAVGCGAFKPFGEDAVEIKRMFVPPAHRQRGIASGVLQELERWARELGHARCVLETGHKQPEAIALYSKRGYSIIPNYGPYVDVPGSVCFEKRL